MVKEPFAPVLLGPTILSRDFTSTAWPFFFSPAKKPRTVFCTLPVASAICATVAPRPAQQRQDLLLLRAFARLAWLAWRAGLARRAGGLAGEHNAKDRDRRVQCADHVALMRAEATGLIVPGFEHRRRGVAQAGARRGGGCREGLVEHGDFLRQRRKRTHGNLHLGCRAMS